MPSDKRKIGRPGRKPNEGERVGLSLRVTPETKRTLDAAAEKAGRSLSQEAEYRLERSFQNEQLLPQLLEMARLHEERARELLQAGDPDGWTDLFAAVTARGEARQRAEADRLLTAGREFAASLHQDEANVVEELSQLKEWLDLLPPAPSVPTPDRTAALAEPVHE